MQKGRCAASARGSQGGGMRTARAGAVAHRSRTVARLCCFVCRNIRSAWVGTIARRSWVVKMVLGKTFLRLALFLVVPLTPSRCSGVRGSGFFNNHHDLGESEGTRKKALRLIVGGSMLQLARNTPEGVPTDPQYRACFGAHHEGTAKRHSL